MSPFEAYCRQRRLGSRQIDVLKMLLEHGVYYHRELGGWCWDTHSNTYQIMERLCVKNCVTRDVAIDCETGRSCELFEPTLCARKAYEKTETGPPLARRPDTDQASAD